MKSRGRSPFPVRRDIAPAVLAAALAGLLGACGEGGGPDRAQAPRAGAPRAASEPRAAWELVLGEEFGTSTLADARFVLEPTAGTTGRSRMLRGGRGVFRRPLAEGSYEVTVRTLVVRRPGKRREIRLDPARVRVSPAVAEVGPGKPEPLRLVVRRQRGRCRVDVVVRTDEGKAVAGARVEVLQKDRGRRLEDVVADLRTNRAGRASVSGLLAGRYRVRLADAGAFAQTERVHADYRKALRNDFELAEGNSHTVTLISGTAGGLEGEVTGFDPETDGKLTVALDRLWKDGVWRPAHTRGRILEGTTFSVSGLAPAKYRITVLAQGREVRATTVEVKARALSRLEVEAGPKNPLRVALEYRPEGRETAVQRGERFNFKRVDDLLTSDVALGILEPGEPLVLDALSAPRPGRYLLILWDRKLAMRVEVGRERSQTIRVVPPAGLLPAGPRTLRVRVEGKQGPLRRLCVGLQRAGAEGPWLRFEEVWYREARFDGLADGRYEILLFDGVFGVTAGFEEQPIRKRVEIRGKDEQVVIRPFGR